MKIIRPEYITTLNNLDRFSTTDLLAPITPKLEESPKEIWAPAWVDAINTKLNQILEMLEPEPQKVFIPPKDRPALDLAGAISTYQKSALFDHGYPLNHHCEMCPHQEVLETFSKNIKDYLKRFPSALE